MSYSSNIQAIAERQPALTENDRRLRGQFVDEYMVDYDAVKAAIRLGYNLAYAKHMAEQFMLDSYVLNAIQERKNEPAPQITDMREWISNELLSRAQYNGPGASETAKIAALRTLIELHNLNTPPVVQLATYSIEGTCHNLEELTHDQVLQQCKQRGLPTRIFENDIEI